MKILLDTNLLARMAQPGHPHHPLTVFALDQLQSRGDTLMLVPQVIYEFWVICTRPVEQNGLGLDPSIVANKIEQAKGLFILIGDNDAIFPIWERLVRDLNVKGKDAHDARMIAAMKAHAIDAILTFNKQDFARYGGAIVLSPNELSPVKG